MKQFKYRAKKSSAETVEGTLLALSKEEAIERISAIGLLPIDVEEEIKSAQKTSRRSLFLSKRVGRRVLSVFYRQLAKLIKSGVPILRALQIVSEQTTNEYFRDALEQIREGVKSGNPFSDSLGEYKKIFSNFDIAMIQTGESVGKLDEALNRLASYIEQQESIISKIRTATAYPIFVITMGLISVFVMLTFVIPKFSVFFEDLGQELPLSTRILIEASEWSKTGWIWIVGAVVAVWFFVRYMNQNSIRKQKLDAFILKIPKVGSTIKKIEIARLARALELLLKSGMQILPSMKMSIPVLTNEIMKVDLEACYGSLERGGYFSEGLKKSKFFPSFVYHMISVGEESGKIDEALSEVAEWYEKETAETIQVFTNLLEPMIILAVGFMLTLIIAAVLMPVFSINTMIQ